MGNLATPKSVQKLQMALHAKAKTEAGYRFYALYDKIYREDILAHAYALCRSNKGAPGVDGQNFADVEAYEVQRWLGELALALKEETYRPDPIRRVFIPKANGKLRPLGIPTVRDRVCMTAAMLVLDPIFDADLPPEQYAYRADRNAQQALVDVEETLFYDHPEVVDADLAASTFPEQVVEAERWVQIFGLRARWNIAYRMRSAGTDSLDPAVVPGAATRRAFPFEANGIIAIARRQAGVRRIWGF